MISKASSNLSISTNTFFDFGENFKGLDPSSCGLSLAPRITSRSEFCTAKFQCLVAATPNVPALNF